jgi:hypothetical protein
MVIEADVEEALRVGVEALGGLCIKLNPFWNIGIPDRLVLLPGGRAIFVELKKPDGKLHGKQRKWWPRTLARLGFRLEVLWSISQVSAFLSSCSR